MKLKIKDFIDKSNPVGFLLLSSMDEATAKKVVETYPNTPEELANSELDINFTVNGVNIDVNTMLTGLYEMLTENITSKAKELVSDAVNDNFNKIVNSLNDVCSKCEAINDDIDWNDIYAKKYTKTNTGT